MGKTYKDSKYRNKGGMTKYKSYKGKEMHKCKCKCKGHKNDD